jgi:hypothetical protein
MPDPEQIELIQRDLSEKDARIQRARAEMELEGIIRPYGGRTQSDCRGKKWPERAPLQIAKLVEYEQRVVAGAAEVTVVGTRLLLAISRALGRIHVGHHDPGRAARARCRSTDR